MDADHFFYYGNVDQRAEIEADLLQGICQDKRSMFYHRSFGAGVSAMENVPAGSVLDAILKYEIVSWIARRNFEVSSGANGTRDRRVVTSQSAVEIASKNGEVEVSVLYVPMFDYEKPSTLTIPA